MLEASWMPSEDVACVEWSTLLPITRRYKFQNVLCTVAFVLWLSNFCAFTSVVMLLPGILNPCYLALCIELYISLQRLTFSTNYTSVNDKSLYQITFFKWQRLWLVFRRRLVRTGRGSTYSDWCSSRMSLQVNCFFVAARFLLHPFQIVNCCNILHYIICFTESVQK